MSKPHRKKYEIYDNIKMFLNEAQMAGLISHFQTANNGGLLGHKLFFSRNVMIVLMLQTLFRRFLYLTAFPSCSVRLLS